MGKPRQSTRTRTPDGGSAPPKPIAGLVELLGASPGRLHLVEGTHRIGRTDAAHIVLTDNTASRDHAVITREQGGVQLVDRGSKNGTYVNDRRIDKTWLSDCDRIRVADTVFKLRCGQDCLLRLDDERDRLKHHDGLTGLPNFEQMRQFLGDRLERSSGEPLLALVSLRIAEYHDATTGHRRDVIRCSVADVLRSRLRRNEFLSCGERSEFLVALPNVDRPGALAWATTIRDTLEHTVFNFEGAVMRIVVTSTCVGLSRAVDGPDALLHDLRRHTPQRRFTSPSLEQDPQYRDRTPTSDYPAASPQHLHELVVGLFSEQELRQFVTINFLDLEPEIAGLAATHAQRALELVQALDRRGRTRELFALLHRERPGRAADIAAAQEHRRK